MDLQTETDRLRLNFLEAELELCFTFAEIARTENADGNREHAEQSLRDANRGYEVVSGFLSDARHSDRLTVEQLTDLKARLGKLRQAIDGVKQSLT